MAQMERWESAAHVSLHSDISRLLRILLILLLRIGLLQLPVVLVAFWTVYIVRYRHTCQHSHFSLHFFM